MAFVVLVGAGLLTRSFARVTAVDPDPRGRRGAARRRTAVRVSPADPATYAALAALLLAASAAAAYVPARAIADCGMRTAALLRN